MAWKDRIKILLGKKGAEKIDEVFKETSIRSFVSCDDETIRAYFGRDAEKLLVVREVMQEYIHSNLSKGVRVRCGSDVYKCMRQKFVGLNKEQFWILLLNGKNRIQNEHRISEGSLTASLVHPREVFKPAIVESAATICLVHNHPSGDSTPSVEDVEITRRLCAVADLVGIRILDHVVIGDGSYVSFLERGLLGDRPTVG